MALKMKDGSRVKTTDDLMEWWVERACLRGRINEYEERSSIHVRDDKIQHYGSHFTLGEILRDGRERPRLFLLNADTWSGGGFGPSTSSRQSDLRRLVAQTDIPSLTVPFSALDGAGIVRSSIKVVEAIDERWTTHDIFTNEPPGPLMRDYVDGEYVEVPDRWKIERGIPDHCHVDYTGRSYAIRTDDGRYHFRVKRHWMGDALFSARSTTWDRTTGAKSRVRLFLSSFDYNEPRPLYFLCELPTRVRRDGANVPVRPSTVAEAIDDLRPDEVVKAQAAEIDVIRQGDVFAIPTSLTTLELRKRAVEGTKRKLTEQPYTVVSASGESFELTRPMYVDVPAKIRKGAHVLGTNHKVTDVIVTTDGDTYARGIMRHDPGAWRTADHRSVKLGDGKTWYRLLKNTVPVENGRKSANQRGQARAWTSVGTVD